MVELMAYLPCKMVVIRHPELDTSKADGWLSAK